MTDTKIKTELAIPIGGKVPDPELQEKLKNEKMRYKRDRFKALILPRLKEAKFRINQIKNCGNRSNYVYTENEAAAIITFLEKQVDELANVFLDPSKEFNAEPIQFDTTEYD